MPKFIKGELEVICIANFVYLPKPNETEVIQGEGELISHKDYLARVSFDKETKSYKSIVTNLPQGMNLRCYGRTAESVTNKLIEFIERKLNEKVY